MVEGALIGTTEFDIFSIDPATCAENWRTHEEYPAYILPTNRGAAYLDGMLFRGTEDGRVLAYDFKTGKRLWETTIADAKRAKPCRRRRSPGRGSSSSATPAATSRAGRGACTRSTPRPARSCGNSSSCPSPRATPFAGPRALRRSIIRRGKTCPALPISGGGTWTSTTLDPATGLLYVPVGNPAPDFDNGVARGRQSLHRLGRRPRRQDRRLQKSFPARAQGLARLGRLQPARSDSDEGRQEIDGGGAEGRLPLRL